MIKIAGIIWYYITDLVTHLKKKQCMRTQIFKRIIETVSVVIGYLNFK